MTLRLVNPLTRLKEPFFPASPDRATMYVCGPTVISGVGDFDEPANSVICT